MHAPQTLHTERSHRVIQYFLERAKSWSEENRDFSLYWSIAHMMTAAQTMRLLALSRGLDPEIAAIAGAIHDIATMESGKSEDHAARAPEFIDLLLGDYNARNESYAISESELALLKSIIPQHSDKEVVSDDPYVELLKDADAIDRYLHGVKTHAHEVPRLVNAFSTIGIALTFDF